jgi:hypothetical protein
MSLSQREATKYIETYLTRGDYQDLFKTDPHSLLSENRRANRSNRVKFGTIAYKKSKSNRISYELEDLQELCKDKIHPICSRLDKIRMAKAKKALEAAYKPYES